MSDLTPVCAHNQGSSSVSDLTPACGDGAGVVVPVTTAKEEQSREHQSPGTTILVPGGFAVFFLFFSWGGGVDEETGIWGSVDGT